MRTLYRAISGKEVGGEPLPLTFKSLQQNEIVLRRAELNLIAGTPGAGKSSIALAIAVQAQVPTLYMSADTNAHTMGMRVVAMATGMTQSNAEQILKQDKDSAENILKQFDYLRWSFESSYNGVFQIMRSNDPQVYHYDTQKWAGMIYLSPNAPIVSGTRMHRSKINGTRHRDEPDCDTAFQGDFYDSTKFDITDSAANIYNRLLIMDAGSFHSAGPYFGNTMESGRLTHLFFFD